MSFFRRTIRIAQTKPHRLKSVLPLPWRYQARCPISSPALASLRRRCPDFPPAQPSCDDQASDHPAHPPSPLYLRASQKNAALFLARRLARIRHMHVQQAKDFLVQQTAEQAALDNVPLSDLEKRMMYFTEGKNATEDPAALNDDFEAQYDTAQFEKKISRLMRRAYSRLKKEDPQKALQWNQAIRSLRRGDHYILVLCGQHLAHGSRLYWRLLAVLFVPWVLFWLFSLLFSFHGRLSPQPPLLRSLPLPGPYATRILQLFFLALLIAAIFFPRAFEPANKIISHCFDWITGPDGKEQHVKR